jgi:hypothetical protein
MTEADEKMATIGGLLLAMAIRELPAIVAALRARFAAEQPAAPPPTDAEVVAAFNAAYALSIVTDDRWLAEHPPPPSNGSDR